MEKGSIAELIAAGAALFALVFGTISCQQSDEAQDDADEALSIARDQAHSEARAEISNYVVDMVRLDREAPFRNSQQVLALAQQSKALIDLYGQQNLNLSASTYRLFGQYVTLTGENTALAKSMLVQAENLAGPEEDPRDVLELIRTYRAYVDIAAEDGEAEIIEDFYDRAIDVAEKTSPDAPEYFDVRDSLTYTRVFALFSALNLAEESHDESVCTIARRFFDDAAQEDDLDELAGLGSLETARRAIRLEDGTPCGLDVDLSPWIRIWQSR
jgi:hypothetical protein